MGGGDGQAGHAGPMGRFHSGRRILHHNATLRRHPQTLRRQEKRGRVRLAPLYLLPGDKGLKQTGDTKRLQDGLDILAGRGGDNGLGNASPVKSVQPFQRPGQWGQSLPGDERPVAPLLGLADGRHPLRRQVRPQYVGDDGIVALAEGTPKGGLIEGDAFLGKGFLPGPVVVGGRIH